MNNRILNLLSILLCLAGVIIAGTLSYYKFIGIAPPCGAGASGCEQVQNHPSSVWFGIPVAVYGLIAYLALLTMNTMRIVGIGPQSKLVNISFIVATLGAAVSIGLQIYSFAVIGQGCAWCIASAVVMAGLFMVHAAIYQNKEPEPVASERSKKLDYGLISLFTIGTIVALAIIFIKAGAGVGEVVSKDKFGGRDPVEFLTENGHSLGPSDAPVTIVEFADLFCGSCRMSFGHIKKLQAENGGKIRWVFRHFPLYKQKDHQFSLAAAVLSEYAAKKGKFWEYITQVYDSNPAGIKSVEELLVMIENINLDRAEAEAALGENSTEILKVHADMTLADKMGIILTPTFILLVEGQPPIALDRVKLDSKLNEASVRKLLGK